jgi:hypothetical protein
MFRLPRECTETWCTPFSTIPVQVPPPQCIFSWCKYWPLCWSIKDCHTAGDPSDRGITLPGPYPTPVAQCTEDCDSDENSTDDSDDDDDGGKSRKGGKKTKKKSSKKKGGKKTTTPGGGGGGGGGGNSPTPSNSPSGNTSGASTTTPDSTGTTPGSASSTSSNGPDGGGGNNKKCPDGSQPKFFGCGCGFEGLPFGPGCKVPPPPHDCSVFGCDDCGVWGCDGMLSLRILISLLIGYRKVRCSRLRRKMPEERRL